MRSPSELRSHYEIERDLAERLRRSKPEERAQLYGEIYDELFRRVPNHPQLARKRDEQSQRGAVEERLALVSRFLTAETVFLEIGAGDCSLVRRVSGLVHKSYALDVSEEILDAHAASNMQTLLSDGCSIPVADGTVTFAYSYQVMEHIHPDDAAAQLRNIYRALAPGGMYLCVTPNKLDGPHDISRYFDSVARGLHLKEYTTTELDRLFRRAGFRETRSYVGLRRRYFAVPVRLIKAIEWVLARLPPEVSRPLARLRGVRNLLFISFVGVK